MKNIKDKINIAKIKKLLDYEITKKEKTTLQEKAVKGLGIFLGIMILCTIFSRFANTLTVPIVTIEGLKPSKISDKVVAEGQIVKNKETKVKVVEGLKVNNINVNIGSNINEGDVIAELDLDDIKEKVEKLNKDISSERRIIERANEDYNRVVSQKQEIVNKALSEKQEAENRLKEEKEKEDKDPVLEESLKAEVEAKTEAYNESVSEANDNYELSRAVEDAKSNSKLDEYNKELSKLQPYLNSSGKVIAKEEGRVTNIFSQNGQVTTDAIIAIADVETGYKFVAQVEGEIRNLVYQGKKVSLELSNNEEVIKDLTIESIALNQEDNDKIDITVNLPLDTGDINDLGKLIISDNSKNYDKCVPISSLRQDDEGYYVLVATEMDSVLGTELIARKLDVEVLKKDDGFVAIEGLISSNDKIIVDSNKNINDGDRVRIDEENN